MRYGVSGTTSSRVQLPCSEHSAWPSHIRLGLEELNCVENPLGYERRVLLGLPRDETP
jgi:hypothetical protein